MVGSFLDFLGFVLAGVRVEFELSSSIALQQCARRGKRKEAGQAGCYAGGPD